MTSKNDLRDRLARTSEINLTVTGRKSGRQISNPVWFVVEKDKLDLLPVKGSDTQWYQNVLKNPSIRIEAGGEAIELRAFTDHRYKTGGGCDGEVSHQVWTGRCEEVLFEARRCCYRQALIQYVSHSSQHRA